jgi:hypothetical protein
MWIYGVEYKQNDTKQAIEILKDVNSNFPNYVNSYSPTRAMVAESEKVIDRLNPEIQHLPDEKVIDILERTHRELNVREGEKEKFILHNYFKPSISQGFKELSFSFNLLKSKIILIIAPPFKLFVNSNVAQ